MYNKHGCNGIELALGNGATAYCPDVRLATDSHLKSESQVQVHSAPSRGGRKKSTTWIYSKSLLVVPSLELINPEQF